jgi:glycosyltransferase involved in cell wall biosynthesis
VLPLAVANSTISNSRATQSFVEHSSVFKLHEKQVIYNGKSWDPYFRSAPVEIRPVPHLVVVGRISPRKGQDVVLAAMSKLREGGIHCTVSFIGDTFPGYEWYLSDLHKAAEAAGLSRDVTYLGFVQDVARELERADIVIVPSRIEPFGTVAAEGMAAMRPTIAAATEGLREIVTDRVTGLTFVPGNSDSLANAITTLIDSPALAASLARVGRDFVVEKYSTINYRTEIRHAVERCLQLRRTG